MQICNARVKMWRCGEGAGAEHGLLLPALMLWFRVSVNQSVAFWKAVSRRFG